MEPLVGDRLSSIVLNVTLTWTWARTRNRWDGRDKGLLVGCDYVDWDAGFLVGQICGGGNSVLRGEFVKYRR